MNEDYIVDLKIKAKGVESATKKIKALEAELSKLDKTSESYKQKQIEIGRVQNASGQSTQKFSSEVGGLKKGLSGGISSLSRFAGVAGVVASALLAAGKEVVAIEKEFTALQKTIQRTAGLTGQALDKAAASISGLAKTFGKETDEINKAANAFAKQTGIEYIEALDLIEKGLLNGADANGDFLEKIQEYPVQFKNAGFSAEEFVKIATQEVRGGIFGDKLLDSVKELGLSIRELDKAQTDALTGAFGSAFTSDFVTRVNSGSLSVKDALGEIIEQSNKTGLSVQQTQKLTADLFKGAGEDAGGFREIIKQLTEAQKINLDSLDELGKGQKEALELSKDLAEEQVKLADTFAGLSTSISNFTTEAQVELLSFFNTVTEEFNLFDSRLNRLAKLNTEAFKGGDPEEVAKRLEVLRSTYTKVTADIDTLKKAIDQTDFYRVDKLFEFNNQLDSAEDNATRLAKEIAILEGFAKKKSVEKSVDPGKGSDKIDGVTSSLKKGKKAVIDYAAEFDKLRKSFESNFERQRLQAQEDRLNGLITEEELQARIFAINQQENAVLISIIQNKKEAAKTGDEDLEVQRLTVKSLEEQSDELTRQLTLRNRLREAEQNLRESEFDIRRSELAVERERELQAVITDESIEGEEDRQKELQKVRDKFAERERQLRIDQVKQQIQDTQAELSTLSQGSTDTSTEAGILNSEKIAETTAAIAGLKAELAGLETQQAEAANKIDTDTESTLDKFAAKAERVNQYFQQVTEGFKQALQADIAATEASLSAQETRIEAGIELAKQGNEELLNQELERQEELLRERERQANQEKAIAAIQVAANLAVAIAKAAAEGGGFGSAATIAAVLGAVGVGLATVPGLISGAFADGVINFQGKGTERSDSNIVAISKGESVITAKGTKNASKLLTGINEGRIKDSDYLSSTFDLEAVNQVSSVIDLREEMYEQISLSAALLDEMRSFYTKIDFTDKGLQQYMQTKNKRITKINKR